MPRSRSGPDAGSGEPPPAEPFGAWKTVRYALATALFALVARLSGLYGRDDSVWVFGARGGAAFADNAKYLYLHAARRRPDVRPIWLSREDAVVDRLRGAGHEAYHVHSLRGIYHGLRAGVVCLTEDLRDVNVACAGGATVVQLWHGIPLKRVGWDAELPRLPLAVRLCLGYLSRRVSLLVVTAAELSDQFASGLRIDRDRHVVAGYPRTDALVGAVAGEAIGLDDGLAGRLDRAAERGPLLFYLPTYRSDERRRFDRQLDLDALEAFLADRGATLAVKPHPKEATDLAAATGPRVVAIPPGNDVSPLLRRADVLVTDYSSVAFDFLLADRPVVFYPYDRARYRGSRGFYFDYDDVTPGPVADDFGALLAALGDVLEGDDWGAERAAVRDRFFALPPGEHAARTFRAVAERARRER